MKTLRFTQDLFTREIQATETEGRTTLRVPALPEGEFDHELYGKLDWSPERFDRMIANFDAKVTGYVPMLNADHATHNPFAAEAPAYGWPVRLEREPGVGLFTVVELTDLGEEAYRNRRYRYFSSEIAPQYRNSKGEEFEDVFTGIAFTNTPFHDTMPGLFSDDLAAQATRAFRMGSDFSFDEIRAKLCEALEMEVMKSGAMIDCYVEEVYPEFFIYELWSMMDGKERHFKRSYTFTDGAVTLADDPVEVEEVWVEKAQQAMSQARRKAQKMERGHRTSGPGTAGKPANGEKRMSTTVATTKEPWWKKAAKALGFSEPKSEEEVVAAIEAAPSLAPAAEPEKEPTGTVTISAAPSDVVSLTQRVETLSQQVTALQEEVKMERDKREGAETALARKSAEDAIQGYVRQGKITPAMLDGDAGKALREFAFRSPVEFKALYDVAAPVIDLRQHGHTLPTTATDAPVSFLSKVAELQRTTPGLDFIAASRKVAADFPALYEQHRGAGGN